MDNMVHKKCCIPGCFVTDERRCCRSFALFEFPKQLATLVVWLEKLNRLGVKLNTNCHVCERHFHPDDVEKENETIKLKPTAVPSQELSNLAKKQKKIYFSTSNYSQNSSYLGFKYCVKMEDDSWCYTDRHLCRPANRSSNISINDDISYVQLCRNLDLVMKPSDWWSINCTKNSVECSKWNETYGVAKKVVVERDLKAKVFVNQVEVNITGGCYFRSIKTISSLLQIVEDLNI